jgi:hypothetical protein
MSPSEKRETARRLLAERARRISTIRRRTVAGALAAFVMAWGVIAWTGSMGTTTSSGAATTTDGATTSSSDSSGATTSSRDSGPSAMTTHQS